MNTNWIEFMKEVDTAKADLGFKENQECFYRGHAKSVRHLTPTLFRFLPPELSEMPDDLAIIESSLYYEFRARAKSIHQYPISDWDILFFMRHHGVSTRLLDWTENLGVALFFALQGKGTVGFSPTIWMLNPYKLNRKYEDSDDLYDPENLEYYYKKESRYVSYGEMLLDWDDYGWDIPVALYPVRRVDRLTSQAGYFTIHGNDVRPLDIIIPDHEKIWKKIILPPDAVPAAEAFLADAGINEYTIYPDLDGLAKYLNQKYFTNYSYNPPLPKKKAANKIAPKKKVVKNKAVKKK
jgi:hypothetical protein